MDRIERLEARTGWLDSSLEYGTKLVKATGGRWSFSLYPEAAEGGGSFRSVSALDGGGRRAESPDRWDPA